MYRKLSTHLDVAAVVSAVLVCQAASQLNGLAHAALLHLGTWHRGNRLEDTGLLHRNPCALRSSAVFVVGGAAIITGSRLSDGSEAEDVAFDANGTGDRKDEVKGVKTFFFIISEYRYSNLDSGRLLSVVHRTLSGCAFST